MGDGQKLSPAPAIPYNRPGGTQKQAREQSRHTGLVMLATHAIIRCNYYKTIENTEKHCPMLSPRHLLPCLLLCLSTLSQAGESAPDFTLTTIPDNGSVTLSGLKGRVVYLDFWATWCPPCRKSFPWMDQVQEEYRDAGLTVVAISIDSRRSLAERFTEQMSPSFTVAHDPHGSVANSYRVSAMPTSFLIDRDGNIVTRHIGFRPGNSEKLTEEIEELLDR